jgi:hypothetical protein
MTPETSGAIYWEDMTLDQQIEVVNGVRNARRQEHQASQEISIGGLVFDFDDDDDDEIEGAS